tara:strand:- start:112111 stop:112365 length:255 start_codon:yes stop_codon:yes gene_type:complete
MNIGDRVRGLLEIRGMPNKLEDKTGIDRDTWRNVRYAKQKVNEDHIVAVCEAFPEYRLWIETGLTAPDSGQISPKGEPSPQKNT